MNKNNHYIFKHIVVIFIHRLVNIVYIIIYYISLYIGARWYVYN